MTQSHQFDKHVTDAKKKRCNRDEKESQARSTTIPHHLTATKKRQRTIEKVNLSPTFPFHFNLLPSEQILYQTTSSVRYSLKIDPHASCVCRTTVQQQSCDGLSAEPGQVVHSCTAKSFF